jgi:hypothetical protein
MVVYPLSEREDRMVRWASRIIPALAGAIILLLGTISLAATQV